MLRSLLSRGSQCTTRRAFHLMAHPRSAGGVPFKHIDTEVNNRQLPFDFEPIMWEKVNKILARYPPHGKQSGIVPLLDLAQQQNAGFVSIAAMDKIAEIVGVPPTIVYENATFYSMFNRAPVGRYHIQVCVTTPCMLRGCDELMHGLEEYLGVHNGDTTTDKMFTLGEMECMGACVNAPMVVISDYSNPPHFRYDFYEDLTVESCIKVLEGLRRGEKPQIGPQNGRKNSIGPEGRTSLHFDKEKQPNGPYCRNLDE